MTRPRVSWRLAIIMAAAVAPHPSCIQAEFGSRPSDDGGPGDTNAPAVDAGRDSMGTAAGGHDGGSGNPTADGALGSGGGAGRSGAADGSAGSSDATDGGHAGATASGAGGGDAEAAQDANGTPLGTGGSSGTGGSQPTDGAVGSDGSQGTGGSEQTDGAVGSGGAPGTGGALGSGGAPGTGGSADAGAAGGAGQCTQALSAPTSLQVSNGTYDTKIALHWGQVPCAERYDIYRSTSANGSYSQIGSTAVVAYDDTNAQDTISYYYKVRAYSVALGDGTFSDAVAGSRKQGYYLVTSWGSQGTGDGQFASAYGIATDASNNVYVLDTYNSRAQKFDSAGTFVTKWGGITIGGEASKFYYPRGIATNAGSVFIADNGAYVRKFSLDGTYVDRFQVGLAVNTYDLDLDTTGSIYLAMREWGSSSGESMISKYSSSYALLTTWGGSGEANGQFAEVIHLAVDSAASLVYVSDSGHSKIQYFTLEGSYVGAWGSTGTGDLQFDRPSGIAVDASGDIYVADQGNDRIRKFSMALGTPTLVASWSSPGCDALTVDSNGRVIVLDPGGYQVRIYQRR